jgi:hypothetical protein
MNEFLGSCGVTVPVAAHCLQGLAWRQLDVHWHDCLSKIKLVRMVKLIRDNRCAAVGGLDSDPRIFR